MKKLLLSVIVLVFSIGVAFGQCNNRPIINSITPNTGFIGSTVTIIGANFDATNIDNNVVFFGATQATVQSATFGQLVVTVPVGASTSRIAVTNQCDLTAYSEDVFNGIFCPTPLDNSTYQNNAQILPITYGAYNMIAVDLDLDGKAEVLSGGQSGGLSVAKNNSTPGNISFAHLPFNQFGASSIYSADFDGDGKQDVVSRNVALLNTSSGPGNISFGSAISTQAVSSYQIAAGDFNNDGKIDIVGETGNVVYVARNLSTGIGNLSFAARQALSNVGQRCTGIQTADVDGDGKIDILMTQRFGNRAVTLRNTTPDGATTFTFEAPEYWSVGGTQPYRCQIADFDKDGRIDLTTCNYDGTFNTAVLINQSTPGNIDMSGLLNLPSFRCNYRIQVGDVDGDGYPDIVSKSLCENKFAVYRNTTGVTGTTSFAPRIDYTSSATNEVSGIVIGDLDGDFVPDIATSGTSSRQIRFHRNTSVQVDLTPPTAICQDITVALAPNGTVSITPEMIDNGSSDACGIDQLTLSQSFFTCQDTGANVVTLLVTDNAGNLDSCSATVTVRPAAIIVSGQTTVCDGQTVPLTANVGDTYQWLRDGVNIPGETNQNYTATVSGDYTVVVTNAGGCSGESDPTAITVNSNPTVAVMPAGIAYLCPTTAVLTASQSAIYQWKLNGVNIPNATLQSYTANQVGTYTVEVIDLFGCSAVSDPITVVNSLAEINVTGNGQSIVDGDNSATSSDGTDFGNTLPNTDVAQSFTIQNSGSGDMEVSSITSSGIDAANWTISGVSFPLTIASGSSANFTATFNGSAVQNYNATLEIVSNDCDETNYDFAVAAEITCVGAQFSVCPGSNVTAYTSNSCNAVVSFLTTATGTNPVAGTYTLSGATTASGAGDASGATFNVGTTTVQVLATNACGVDTCTFDVVVLDTIAPSVSTQDISVFVGPTGTALITAAQIDNGSSDACGVASVSVSPTTFDCNNVGINPVVLTVTDANGNTATGTANVTVQLNCTGNIDLNTWTQEGNPSAGNWSVVADGSSVFQSINGSPTFYVSPDTFFNTVIEGGFGVQTTGDDDFIGFVLGYNSPNSSTANNVYDMLLFDWKQGAQAGAPQGMRLTRIQGTSTDEFNTFWTKNTSASTILGTNTSLGGWADNTNYDFRVEYTATNVKVWIDDTQVFDVNGTFSPGRFGFYNYSQSSVQYQGFIQPFSTVVNATNATCPGASDGSAVATPTSGGVAPYTYAWSTGDTTSSVSGLAAGTYSVVITAANCCFDTATFTILDVDTENPNAQAQDLTVYLDAGGNASITAGDVDNGSTDNCGIASVSINSGAFTCSQVGMNNVTLTVTDNSGNSSTTTSTVTVIDSTAPIAAAQDLTVYLDASGNASITAADVNNGSDDACGVSVAIDNGAFTCANVGANTVTLTATDDNGNSSTATSTVTVIDSVAPVALAQDVTVYLDASGNASITATDIDNGSDDACGIASLVVAPTTFDCSNVGANTVTLTATDNNGNSSTATATVTVIDSVAPIAAAQDITVSLDANGSVSITDADINNGSSDACGIASTSIDASSFGCADVGPNMVTLTVTDINGNSSITTATVNVVDDLAPNAIAQDVTVYLDANGNASITVADVDNGSNDNCGIASTTISNNSFDCVSVNGSGLQIVSDSTWMESTVADSSNSLHFPWPGAAVVPAASTFTLPVSLGQPYSFTSINPIPGSEVIRANTHVRYYRKTFSLASLAGISTRIRASFDDDVEVYVNGQLVAGEYSFAQSSFQGVPHDLLIDGSGAINGNNGGDMFGFVSSTSIDSILQVGTNEIILALRNRQGNDRGGITFVMDVNGTALGNPVVLTVTDVNGNSSQATANVTVIDTVAPVITRVPASFTAYTLADDCTPPVFWQLPLASDACSVQSLVGTQHPGDHFQVGVTTVTYTATDVNGNMSNVSFDVTVVDTIAPTSVCQNITVNLDATGNASIIAADVDGGSTDACGIASTTIDVSSFDCSNVGANFVTLTNTDIYGNASSCTAMVTVADVTAPQAVCQNITVALDANGDASIAAADVDNGSDDACGIASLSIDQANFTCAEVGANTVTLTVTDNNGNVSTCQTQVTIIDTIAPTVLVSNISILLDVNGNASISPADVDNGSSDACGIASFDVTPNTFGCNNLGSNTVTLSVIDNNGNINTATANVEVQESYYVELADMNDIDLACNTSIGGKHVTWNVPSAGTFSSCSPDTCPAGTNIPGFIFLGQYNGHRYFCSDNSNYTWYEADAAAQAAGGHLAVINSAQENHYLACRVQAYYSWIGLTDQTTEGTFEWVNGDPVNYTKWSYYEPNNTGGYYCGPGGADHTVLKRWSGKWYDRRGGNKHEFIMEVPCGNDVVIAQVAGPTPGSLFTTGSTTVTYVATDTVTGATDSTSFDVTIGDCTPVYCNVNGNTSHEWINRVKIGGVDNTSGNDGGYGDYTNLTVHANTGQKVYMKLYPGFAGKKYKEYWAVYVDWNNDGDFYDYKECVYTGKSKKMKSGNFKVPSWAAMGNLRVRVVMRWGGYGSSCGYCGYGEAEDYTLVVDNATGGGASTKKGGSIADSDGDVNTDQIVTQEAFDLYPNPVESGEMITVGIRSANAEETTMSVFSSTGQIIHTENVELREGLNTIEVRLQDLRAGTYFVKTENQTEAIPFIVK